MDEHMFIPGTCSSSWKEVGRRVSTEKSSCPIGFMMAPLANAATLEEPTTVLNCSWGALSTHPRSHSTMCSNSICFLSWFQQHSPTYTESKMWWGRGFDKLTSHRPQQSAGTWQSVRPAPAFSLGLLPILGRINTLAPS